MIFSTVPVSDRRHYREWHRIASTLRCRSPAQTADVIITLLPSCAPALSNSTFDEHDSIPYRGLRAYLVPTYLQPSASYWAPGKATVQATPTYYLNCSFAWADGTFSFLCLDHLQSRQQVDHNHHDHAHVRQGRCGINPNTALSPGCCQSTPQCSRHSRAICARASGCRSL